jgi:hypothetical protein
MPQIEIEPVKCRLDKISAAATSGASCHEFCLYELAGCAGCPQRRPGEANLAFGGGSNEIRGSPRLDPGLVPHFKSGATPQTDQEASMEQFVHQQNIAIFRRLLNTQTDNDEARRERLLKLLADEEAKSILSAQHDMPPGSAFASPR